MLAAMTSIAALPRQGRRPAPPDPWHDPENHFAPVTGTRDRTRHEVTAQVPPDAISIIFGVFLNGRGQIELRNPQLDPDRQTSKQGCGDPLVSLSAGRRITGWNRGSAGPPADSGSYGLVMVCAGLMA
jgi:hypothetical protein